MSDGNGPIVSVGVTAQEPPLEPVVGVGDDALVGESLPRGLFFTALPEVREELAGGRLVRVLPDWSLPRLSIDALLPPRTKQPAKVRAALDALASYLSRQDAASNRPRGGRLR